VLHSKQPFSRWAMSRRLFLGSAAAGACWPFLKMRLSAAPDRRVPMPNDPFQLGVASGDPSSEGIVLWTRLAPDPLNGGGLPPEDIQVYWQVAHDEGMTKIVQKGVASAAADWAHSVHVEVDGLEPDRGYFYQFKVGNDVSPVGRTRTAPVAHQMLDRFRFAFASCQHYEAGYYTAYEHMAREDLNLVIHLGDYIYEGKAGKNNVRSHIGDEIQSLEDYRNRHALYKTDLHLQAAHAAFPWLVTWDDHEVDNNYAGELSEKLDDPAVFLQRRANAYKAYYEHMQLRRVHLPHGPHLPLYRNVSYGSLVRFSMLDTRQYRTDQPCGDKRRAPCEEVTDPEATLLGPIQEKWLYKQLAGSQARWNVLAQQVLVADINRGSSTAPSYAMDSWSGYAVARTRLMRHLADHPISNPIILTGDSHSNWVNELKIDFDDPQSPTVATEFGGTSISSKGDGHVKPAKIQKLLSENSFVKFHNDERGYVRCDLNQQKWTADYRVVDYVTRPGAPCQTRASFVVEDGQRGVSQA